MVSEPVAGRREIPRQYLRAMALSSLVHRGDGDRAKATERFPHHIARIRSSHNYLFQQSQRFLVHVHALVGVFYSFFSANRRFLPDVGDSDIAVEFCSHPQPIVRRSRVDTIQAVIWPALWVPVLVGVSSQRLKRFRRREVPQVTFGQIFARGSVLDPARGVGLVKGQSAAFPLPPQSFLQGYRRSAGRNFYLADILGAHLGDHRKATQRLAVCVPRNVSDPFVPYMTGTILPSEFHQHGMYAGPAYFCIPKPKRGLRQRPF